MPIQILFRRNTFHILLHFKRHSFDRVIGEIKGNVRNKNNNNN